MPGQMTVIYNSYIVFLFIVSMFVFLSVGIIKSDGV